MKTSEVPHSQISRRGFLGGLAMSTAAFHVIPGSALGLNGAEPPSNRLNVAAVGCGGQGGHDIQQFAKENVVALCDVDWRHAAGSFNRFPQAKRYKDYRKMLDEMGQSIDAVTVATPDHQHALASIMAMKMGKHVYCEKPLTHSVWEARQMAQVARAAKVATQMGNQGQASDDTRRLCELVWHGAIGPVREAHVWTDRPSQGLFNEYWPQGVPRPADTPPVPADLDWDLWLGPAPERPYNPAYLPFRWRGWWDFGTGALGDIGCHSLDPVFRALKLGAAAPLAVQASSTRVNTETYPLGSMVTYYFPERGADVQSINYHVQGMTGVGAGGVAMPPVKVVWYDGGLRPPRPRDLPEDVDMGDNGRLLIGDEGYLLGNSLFPESRAKNWPKPPQTIPRAGDHYQQWAEACKGGPPAGANFDWAGPLAEAVLLGNVALRVELRDELTRTMLQWDPQQLQIPNLPQANQFIRRTYRDGWQNVIT